MRSFHTDATPNDGELRVYCDAKQGGRMYMEDVICVRQCTADNKESNGRYLKFFAVFDGHGGPEAAHFAKENLRDEIVRQPGFWNGNDDDIVQAIKDGFISTHKLMHKTLDSWPQTMGGLPSTAGTTASVVILRDGKIFVAHVGDSSVVFGERKGMSVVGKFIAKCVTVEHKPDCDKERARIENCGGEVVSKAGVNRVVWKRPRSLFSKGLFRRPSTGFDSIPFLAVSRSLGDLWSYNAERDLYVVSPEPDVSVFKLDRRRLRFLIIASDGVWNMMSPEGAVDCVSDAMKSCNAVTGDFENSAENPATALVETALDHWTSRCMRADNTSAIVVMFESPEEDQRRIRAKAAKRWLNKFEENQRRITDKESKRLAKVFSSKHKHCKRTVICRKAVLLRRRGFAARRAGWPMFCPRRSKEMIAAVNRWYGFDRTPAAGKDSEQC